MKTPYFFKKMTLLLALVVLLSAKSFAFSGGDGLTVGTPYLISNSADVVEFGAYANNDASYYKLTANIDMTGVTYNSSSNTFKGFFDGDGNKILNLTLTRVAGFDGMAFITAMNGGEVKNLGLENITVAAPANCRHNGGIIGQSMGAIAITNCFVSGIVSATDGDSELGAFIGQATTGSDITLTDCYADATVSPKRDVGGIVGQVAAWGSASAVTLVNCVSYGTASANATRSHALVGYYVGDPGTATFTDCYYAEGSTNDETAGGTTKVLAADLNTQGTYLGFDFGTTWYMNSDNGRAELKSFEAAVVTSDITYVNMDGVDNTNNPSTFTNQESVTLNDPTGTKSGFAWAGWFTDAAFTVAVSTPAIALGVETDQTFYGKWISEVTSNISYVNMDDVDNSNNPASYTNAASVTLSDPSGTKAGFWWDGWFIDAGLSTAISIPAIAQGATGDLTFYGKWTAKPGFSGGAGTELDPFLIATVQDLIDMDDYDSYSYFKLSNNIDMTGEEWIPLTSRGTDVEFLSSFDGNNKVIRNLTITGTENTVGFARLLGGANYIKNLGLESLTINAAAYNEVGGISGTIWNNDATIENCFIRGNSSITGKTGVGGLVGFGWTIGNSIKNNFVDAAITGTNEVGGFVGRCHLGSSANFDSCTFYGSVTGSGGAIIGGNQASVDDLQSGLYYVSGITSSLAQTGAVEVADLTVQANFPGLDFVNIWRMTSVHPVLMTALDYPTALNKNSQAKLRVYPNPASSVISVNAMDVERVKFYSATGQLVKEVFNSNTISTSDLSSGVYFLQIETKSEKTVTKLIIE